MGIDPETGDLIQASVEDETKQVLENLKATLEAAGASLSDVVKTTVFLTDLTKSMVSISPVNPQHVALYK